MMSWRSDIRPRTKSQAVCMKRSRAISERKTTPKTVRMQRPSRYPLMVRLDGKVVPLAIGKK